MTQNLEQRIVDHLRAHGASFFAQIHAAVGGFPNDLVDTIWSLVWKGLITNDTFHALRALTRPKTKRVSGGTAPGGARFRSRRLAAPLSAEGRWSLVPGIDVNATQRANALAHQMLARYGVVTREAPGAEGVQGGFGAVYPVLKAMEEAGRIRRGYFVAGLGATQFASGGAIDLLRSFRDDGEKAETVMLAATDPANPYGTIVKWPLEGRFTRSVGANVILVNGALAAYIGRGEKQLSVFLPDDEPSRGMVGREVARMLAGLVDSGQRRALLIAEVNDEQATRSVLAPYLAEHGFIATAMGFQKRAKVA
jgi:ATP-dependent Lhr-like helicase